MQCMGLETIVRGGIGGLPAGRRTSRAVVRCRGARAGKSALAQALCEAGVQSLLCDVMLLVLCALLSSSHVARKCVLGRVWEVRFEVNGCPCVRKDEAWRFSILIFFSKTVCGVRSAETLLIWRVATGICGLRGLGNNRRMNATEAWLEGRVSTVK